MQAHHVLYTPTAFTLPPAFLLLTSISVCLVALVEKVDVVGEK